MLHHCLIITFSWFGSVSLQYINTGGPGADVGLDSMDGPQYPIPYVLNSPSTRADFDTLQNDPLNEQFYQRDDVLSEIQRKRRLSDDKEEIRDKRYAPNMIDKPEDKYLTSEDQITPYLVGFARAMEENATANEILQKIKKQYFSPWGGKRDMQNMEQMWTWKRANNIREPSMPKRVRFSPWGGKRSGQMVFKPGSKSSKIIFSTTIPELTKIVSNTSPNEKRLHFVTGFQYIPILDKRHQINIRAAGAGLDDRTIRDAMPFKMFIETLPKFFKPGHPYLDVNLKKDGKRKVKFSAWGGKRSPPIIGPIWTPATDQIKDSTFNSVLLLRNSKEQDKFEQNMMSKAS